MTITDARLRLVSVVNDLSGQALARDESDAGGVAYTGGPQERWYRFTGREVGHIGNHGGAPTDCGASLVRRAGSRRRARSATTRGTDRRSRKEPTL